MQRIAKFHKVSFQQFEKDWKDTFAGSNSVEIQNIYDTLSRAGNKLSEVLPLSGNLTI